MTRVPFYLQWRYDVKSRQSSRTRRRSCTAPRAYLLHSSAGLRHARPKWRAAFSSTGEFLPSMIAMPGALVRLTCAGRIVPRGFVARPLATIDQQRTWAAGNCSAIWPLRTNSRGRVRTSLYGSTYDLIRSARQSGNRSAERRTPNLLHCKEIRHRRANYSAPSRRNRILAAGLAALLGSEEHVLPAALPKAPARRLRATRSGYSEL